MLQINQRKEMIGARADHKFRASVKWHLLKFKATVIPA